jgi:hypothetical protein
VIGFGHGAPRTDVSHFSVPVSPDFSAAPRRRRRRSPARTDARAIRQWRRGLILHFDGLRYRVGPTCQALQPWLCLLPPRVRPPSTANAGCSVIQPAFFPCVRVFGLKPTSCLDAINLLRLYRPRKSFVFYGQARAPAEEVAEGFISTAARQYTIGQIRSQRGHERH